MLYYNYSYLELFLSTSIHFSLLLFFFMNKNGYFSVNNKQDPPSKNALLKNTLPKRAFMNTFP